MSLIDPIHKQILHLLPQTFPGLDRIVVLYQTEEEKTISGEELLRANNQYINRIVSMNASMDMLMPKNRTLGYIWLHPNEVPFEKSHKTTIPNLFDEAEHLVLNLIITKKEKEKELYYLFFRNDLSNFGINSSNTTLDTFQKMFIGTTLSKIISQLYKSNSTLNKKITEFTSVTKLLLENINSKKTTDTTWHTQWVNDILAQNSTQPHGEWIIDPAALEIIKSITDYNICKQSILNAASISSTLYSNDDNWPILASFITVTTTPIKETIVEKPKSRMARVELWLDSVEEAASELIAEGEEATGAAVGSLLTPPVSAPAITDWLRKNQVRVNIALDNNNKKWPVIRTYFRPLINIIQKEESVGKIS